MSDHITPVRTYVLIFAALLVLTAVTVAAAFVDFGGILNDVIALAIAVSKAMLVILWFMHVKYNTRLTWAFVASGFFWLLILFLLTLGDYLSRPWQYQAPGWEPVGPAYAQEQAQSQDAEAGESGESQGH